VRVIVVGLGVQGAKRKTFAGPDFVTAVDPVNAGAEYRNLRDVPVERYDAALCCIPDGPKIELLTYLAEHGKHALVEKPLWAADDAEIGKL
jgi:scyllo-inositol 2-dehydrogenase (NADP+)